RHFCAGGLCRAATPDFAGDVAALAGSVDESPLQGPVRRADGRLHTVEVTWVRLLNLVLSLERPGIAAELPAAVHAARGGDARPLLRLSDLVYGSARRSSRSPSGVNGVLNLATICRDGPLPWPAETPVAGRQELIDAAVAALPSSFFGPFGDGVAKLG